MTQSGQQTQRTSINSDNRELGSGSRLPTWWGPRVYGGGGGKRDPALFWGANRTYPLPCRPTITFIDVPYCSAPSFPS